MTLSFRRHLVPGLLFLLSLVSLAGFLTFRHRLANPHTESFPESGRFRIGYSVGNTIYSVWYRSGVKPACAVVRLADKTPVDVKTYDLGNGEEAAGDGMKFAGRFEAVKEGAYEVALTGVSPGAGAVLVEENDVVLIIPALVCAALAFVSGIAGAFALYVIRRRHARTA